MNILRIGAVLVGVVAAGASATAPAKHDVQRATSVSSDFDATWSALVDLFADRNWAILQLSKESGIITTDWHSLGDLADVYADCGGSGLSSVHGTQVRFNVRVKSDDARSEVIVNASFRQLRSFDNLSDIVDCASRGAVEALIHEQVRQRLAGRPAVPAKPENPANDPKLAVAFWCSGRDGACSADASACVAPCLKLDEVWCARYATGGGGGFLCSSTRNTCLTLRDIPEHRRGRSDFGECVKQKATGQAIARTATQARPASASPSASTPRGYFCATSTSASTVDYCVREKAECQRVRDALVGAIVDLGECRLVETAFCFDAGDVERCSPTAEGCHTRLLAAPSYTSSCGARL